MHDYVAWAVGIAFISGIILVIFRVLREKKKKSKPKIITKDNPLEDGYYLVALKTSEKRLHIIRVSDNDYQNLNDSHASHLIKELRHAIFWTTPNYCKDMQLIPGKLFEKKGEDIKPICLYKIT